jgi:hypothetical protein
MESNIDKHNYGTVIPENDVELSGDEDQLPPGSYYEQNFGAAIIWGAIAAIVGAIIWAGITAVTKYQIGWMAVGIGVLVGFSVRKFGGGYDQIFGFIGAGFALFGCLLGNLLATLILAANEFDVSFFEVLSVLDPGVIFEIMKETFHPMDLLFYGIAIFEGYKFSFKPSTETETIE